VRNGVFPAELDGKVFQYYSFYFNLELYNYNYNYDYRKKNVQLQHHGWPPETKETGMQRKETARCSSTTARTTSVAPSVEE